jgi:hypothetical protein
LPEILPGIIDEISDIISYNIVSEIINEISNNIPLKLFLGFKKSHFFFENIFYSKEFSEKESMIEKVPDEKKILKKI